MRPLLPRLEDVAPRLEAMDEARIYTNLGPLVRELEARHAQRLGADPEQVVSVANATLGLIGAVALSPASRWAVPDFTFPATGHAVLQAGRKLLLADIRESDWQLDVGPIPATAETGIMPVLPFGAAMDAGDWGAWTHVIVDAAASLGDDDWSLGALPDTWAVVFSLHATKTLPAGEGGLVVFGSREQARRFRAWSNFGFAGTRLSSLVGTNAKVPEVTAAYGLASLEGWEEERAEWLANLDQANGITRQLGLATPVQENKGAHPYWIVRFSSAEERVRVTGQLEAAGIETRQWWPVPLRDMQAFGDVETLTPSTVSARVAATSLGLPMYRGIGHQNIQRIGDVLESALKA